MTEQELLQKVKILMQIKTSDRDEYLNAMIPVLIDSASDYCNQTFSIVDNLPSGVILYIAKACEFYAGNSGLKSRSMGNVSYSFNTDMPDGITAILRPYKRLRFV